MLNLCFSVLWVFLMSASEQGQGSVAIDSEFREQIECLLARDFLRIFAVTRWEMLVNERETQLLMISMLVNFFIKQNIMVDQMHEIFRFMLDRALCNHILRVTDFDVQRMLLKKETRFAFLLMSFLSQIHQNPNSEQDSSTSLFKELLDCSQRFKQRMLASQNLADKFEQWC